MARFEGGGSILLRYRRMRICNYRTQTLDCQRFGDSEKRRPSEAAQLRIAIKNVCVTNFLP